MKKMHLLFAAGCLLGLGGVVHADTIAIVSFDNLPQGPSVFSGVEQTVTPVPGVASFSGGEVLGDTTNFPAIIFATAPNVYGTIQAGNLSSTMTISVDPSFTADEISFALFNGNTVPVSYVVDAFSGATLEATQTFTNVPANFNSGFVLPDLLGTNLTSVTIAPTTGSSTFWDFEIDSIAFNESVTQAIQPTPEPSSFLLLGTGLTCAAGELYRRARRTVQ
jgi:hypothetical protein